MAKEKKKVVKLAKEVYYYIRDKQNHPRGTVCIAKCDDTNELVKGLALCSMSEMPIKAFGRKEARRNAIIAANRKRNSCYIKRDEAHDVLSRINALQFICRSMYPTKAWTSFEQKLIDKYLILNPA
jgi:hypothetical protein